MEGSNKSSKLEDIGTVEFLQRLKGKRSYEEDEGLAKLVDKYVDTVINKPFQSKLRKRTEFEGPATLGKNLPLREDFYAYAYLYLLRRAYFFEQDYYGDDSNCDSEYYDHEDDKLKDDREFIAEEKAKARERKQLKREKKDLAAQGEEPPEEFTSSEDLDITNEEKAEERTNKERLRHFYDDFASDRDYTFGKLYFLVMCQLVLLGLLGSEALTDEDVKANFFMPADSLQIVMCRFLCAIVLHITLTDEVMQGFACMKYALNHPYKFRAWTNAYFVAFTQLMVVIVVEVVNLAILCTNHTIMDIIMNFLALVIIADFDDFFFFTVEKEMMAEMIKEKSLNLLYGERQLSSIVLFERTTSVAARFKLDKNKILINGKTPEEAWKKNREEGMDPKNNHIRIDRDEQSKQNHIDRMAARAKRNASKNQETRPEYIYVDPSKLPWGRWFLRKVYTAVHALFASFWFYFIPFSSIFLSYSIPHAYNQAYYTDQCCIAGGGD